MSSFRFVIGEEAARQILWMAPNEQWQAWAAIESLSRNPNPAMLPDWRAEDGRAHYLRNVHGGILTFWIDDAERTIRVLAVDPE